MSKKRHDGCCETKIKKKGCAFRFSHCIEEQGDRQTPDLTEEETQVILKEIKQLKETIEMTPADRTDILTECNSRLAVLEEYAPKMMDEAEIKAVVSEVLTSLGLDAPTAKEKGKIMKELMPKVKGKADGKLVSEVVASFLS